MTPSDPDGPTLLVVRGAVQQELALRLSDLASLPGQIDDVARTIPGRRGGAVRMASVLAAAIVSPDAGFVELRSGDGRFSASVPVAALESALLVYRLADQPLPAELGGPVRLLIPDAASCGHPGVDTCANVKSLASIRLSSAPGRDDRPDSPAAHEQLHRTPGHEHLESRTGADDAVPASPRARPRT